MADELNLMALREHYSRLGPTSKSYQGACAFILNQIERVEGCGCCNGWVDCGCEKLDKCEIRMACRGCSNLRADLLELQKSVMG
jgi:hypothetical protein